MDANICVNASLFKERVLHSCFILVLNSSGLINNRGVMVLIILVSSQNYSKGVPLTELTWTYTI